MAAGASVASFAPLFGTKHGTTMLDATLDSPATSRLKVLAPTPAGRGARALHYASAVSLALKGTLSNNHGEVAVFDRINILPTGINLGTIAGDVLLQVEIWNAWHRGQTLASVPVTGPAGVSVNSGTLPRFFPWLHSEIEAVHVTAAGVDAIDNVISWLFTALGSAGCTLTLTGGRALIFPGRPNGVPGIVERVTYRTDVISGRDRTEQRIQLRQLPDQELQYTVTVDDSRDGGDLVSLIWTAGSGVLFTPYWPDLAALAAPVAAADTTVYIDTTTRSFASGAIAVLWRDQKAYRAIFIDQVFPDHLTLTQAVGADFAQAGTFCVPTIAARLLAAPPVKRASGDVADVELVFSGEAV